MNFLRGLKIAYFVSIGGILAAFIIDPFPVWVALLSWGIFITLEVSRIAYAVPNDNPYKQALVILALPALIVFTMLENPILAFLNNPTFENVLRLVTSKPVLVLIIIYFASACLFLEAKCAEKKPKRRVVWDDFDM